QAHGAIRRPRSLPRCERGGRSRPVRAAVSGAAVEGPRAVAPHTRRYLHEIFVELCRIDSPSRHERACAERVRSELEALGIDVLEDSTRGQTGSDSGNLLARVPARATA